MSVEVRLARIRDALDRRLGWVACAVQAVRHRHNVSAILRTCDALGVHQVHLVEGHFHPTRGASRGAERWLDLHQHTDSAQAVRDIQERGYRVYVADIDEHSVTPEQVPLDRPVCLWFGAELLGVAPEARAAADGVVSIPMHGLSQSLNVSVATALALRPVAERARREVGAGALLSLEERQMWWERWLQREKALQHALQGRFDEPTDAT